MHLSSVAVALMWGLGSIARHTESVAVVVANFESLKAQHCSGLFFFIVVQACNMQTVCREEGERE